LGWIAVVSLLNSAYQKQVGTTGTRDAAREANTRIVDPFRLPLRERPVELREERGMSEELGSVL
jgi:hypothetical protein